VQQKKQLFDKGHADPAWRRYREACDRWAAAFFQPLTPSAPTITSAALLDVVDGRTVPLRVAGLAFELSERNRFFHWPLEFPEVFAAGGFDVMIFNPPWERVKLQEKEFFAVSHPRIANAPAKAARTKPIKELSETNPTLHASYREALRSASGSNLTHGTRGLPRR
jgi:hypothetical protein